jgi:hypothetical protein
MGVGGVTVARMQQQKGLKAWRRKNYQYFILFYLVKISFIDCWNFFVILNFVVFGWI